MNNQQQKTSIAIFASGTGTNADNIIRYFKTHPTIQTSLIVCNKPDAGVLKIATAHHVPTLLIKRERFFKGDVYIAELHKYQIDFLVLAGFLWKVPSALINAYRNKIVNIHPALLPAYGGKGMYSSNVHEAVIAGQENQTGITIHFVDEHYDNGDIIFQATCPVLENDTAKSLAEKVHQLEHEHYPVIIEKLLTGGPAI